MIFGNLKSGEEVVDRYRSHLHPGVLAFLPQALARTESWGREFFVEEVDFGHQIGETICVVTGPDDKIVYAQRPRRRGLTRFVKNRKPEPSSALTLILKKADDVIEMYVLITAFVGNRPEPEPWDRNAIRTRSEYGRAREFWATHALVWDSEEVVPGTTTTHCPWRRGVRSFYPYAVQGEIRCSSCNATLSDRTGRIRDGYYEIPGGGPFCEDCRPL